MRSFPIEWYVIDEEKGWVLCSVVNVMDDPGDGSDHEESNWTLLHYAGDGLFSYEEDMYNPVEFGEMIKGWLEAKKAAPRTRTCCNFAPRTGIVHRADLRPDRTGGQHRMEFGIFNSLYMPHQAVDGRDAGRVEHERLMDEVAWTVAADQAGFKYTWATEHHFLDGVLAPVGERVVPAPTSPRRPRTSTSAPASSTSRRR